MLKKFTLLALYSQMAIASDPGMALSMIPKGKLVEQIGRDFIVKTEAGTKIYVEFKRSGKFEEAKGHNLNKGDDLEPGEGLVSLSSAAQALVKKGIIPQGTWHLDLDENFGWVYEMENTLINARSGQIISEEQHLTAKQEK